MSFGTQSNAWTPNDDPSAEYVQVQVLDDTGQPRSDVMIVSLYGDDQGLFLMPLLMTVNRATFPGLVDHFWAAIRYANVNGGKFDAKAFVESQYAAMHTVQPPDPVTVTTPPKVITPVDMGLAAANARIEAYAAQRGIGEPFNNTFAIASIGYGRNYTGKTQAADGLCIVIDSVHGTFLVRNGFFLEIAGNNSAQRAKLGAPLEDEHGQQFGSVAGAVQHFERGFLTWRSDTGLVTPTFN